MQVTGPRGLFPPEHIPAAPTREKRAPKPMHFTVRKRRAATLALRMYAAVTFVF